MLSELQAVNRILRKSGVKQVTAKSTRHPYYLRAAQLLNDVSINEQSEGMWFNTSFRTLKRNTDKGIYLPSGTLSCDPVDADINAVPRGLRLWDLKKQTYKFDKDIKVRVVLKLEFEELPAIAQSYYSDRAAYEFYIETIGEEPKLSYYRISYERARIKYLQEDLRNKDVNYFTSVSRYNTYPNTLYRQSPKE